MKKWSLYIIILFLLPVVVEAQVTEDSTQESLGFRQELKKTFIEGPSKEDCLDKILNFESEFLAGLKALEGYSWDEDRFTARLEISDDKRVYVELVPYNFECEVRKTATFVVPRNFGFIDHKNEIISDLLWISKLISTDKEFEKIKRILTEANESMAEPQNEMFIFLYPKFEENGFDETEALNTFFVFFQKELDSNRYTIIYN